MSKEEYCSCGADTAQARKMFIACPVCLKLYKPEVKK